MGAQLVLAKVKCAEPMKVIALNEALLFPLQRLRTNFMDERTIWIQVRCTCGKETGGMMVDNFTGNSETGAIWERFEPEGKPLTYKRLDAVRKRIFKPQERGT